MSFLVRVLVWVVAASSTVSGAFSPHHPAPTPTNCPMVSSQQLAASVNDARLLYPSMRPPPTPTPAPAPKPQPKPAPVVVKAPTPPPVRVAPKPVPFIVGSEQQALINQDRASAGLARLNWSSCLASIAAAQAQAMANAESIYHGAGVQEDFNCRLGSVQTGENVGVWGGGINDAMINTLFMESPDHRANIMGPYHYVATAWAVGKNGAGYIAVEFG